MKQTILKYRINGCLFHKRFENQPERAQAAAAILVANGIAVTVTTRRLPKWRPSIV